MNKYLYLIILLLSFNSNISAQWFMQESGTTDLLWGIKFVDNNNGWVTNLNGTKLFHTTNGGTDWFVQKDFGTGAIWNFTFINDSIGYIYSHGTAAHLLKTTDGGFTWQTICTFSSLDALAFYNENIAWGTSNELSGNLFKTTNGGLNWQNFDYFISFDGLFGRVGIINENSVIVPGYYFNGSLVIFKTTDGGTNWASIPVTDTLMGGRIQFINDNTGWIESNFKLYKTTDGGYNWQMQVPSVYDFFFVNENSGWYINGDQIYRTTDGGQSWIQQNSGTNNALYTIFFSDPNNGWVSGDNGTILYTPNGGTPVEFISFTSSVTGNSITLNWGTATETNNSGFDVEKKDCSLKSPIGNEWTRIGFVQGNGTTTKEHSYSFTDENLVAGKYLFRLKQVDYDGTYQYSDVIEVEVAPKSCSLAQNYPNPFNPTTIIKYQINSRQFVSLKIYDVLGNEIVTLVNKEQPEGNYSINFDGSNLPDGVYFYQIKTSSYIETKKMIILK